MPTEEACSRLIPISIVHDLIDLIASLIPLAGEAIDSITDQIQLNAERELLSNEEFESYRRFYALPAGIRAMLFCYLKTGRALPKLPTLDRG